MDEHASITYDVSMYKHETVSWNHDPSAYLLRYYKKHFVQPLEKYRFKDQTTEQPQQPQQEVKQENETSPEDTNTTKDEALGTKYYQGDQYVYQSPNKLCVIGLAPSHPLLAQRDRFLPISIQFDARAVSQLPQPSDKPSVTKKLDPPRCSPGMLLCKIVARDTLATKNQISTSATTTDATSETAGPVESTSNTPNEENKPDLVTFAVRAAMAGQVLEFNERLIRRGIEVIEDPQVLGTLIDKAATHGYIAVIRPKNENLDPNVFISLEEYRTRIDPTIAASIATLPSSSKLVASADDD
ncbi:hypothetical protein BGW42_000473 [Actinomortierella wolfii]|nr:hypothetical protein BGW42_000473 [Actinomortierella wolfii]